jgi:dinuclear metal center YbgI/SA1388 family protein
MTTRDLDQWFRRLLAIDALTGIDDSLNGIQVDRSPGPVERVAFAVDASAESIRRAAESGAQLLFVHHGLFWGKPARIEGNLRARVKLLLDSDLALYACHLPLDSNPEVGNNAAIARLLGLVDLEPFGLYHGVKLGFKGRFEVPVGLDEALARLGPAAARPLTLIPAGPAKLGTASVISGGGAMEALQAIKEGLDLHVTGEASHSVYNDVVEARINFAALGHYATETFGVKAVAERLALETGIETRFLDIPTGL